MRKWLALSVRCIAVCVGLMVGILAGGATPAVASGPPSISVVGNQLRSGGVSVQLRGVNRSAYATCSGSAVYDAEFAGPVDNDPDDDFADGPVNQWSIDVMKAWGIDAVRLPINESCWLGEPTAQNAVPGQSPEPNRCETYAPSTCESAADYQGEVENYVNLLGQNGLYVILDLQDTAPPGYAADQVDHFPDEANAPSFWAGAAQTFGSDPYVLFDLTGEIGASPYAGPDYSSGTYGYTVADAGQQWTDSDIWNCWLNGCDSVPSRYDDAASQPVTYDTAGVEQLINTIRGANADNPIIVGSPDFDLGYDEDDCAAAGSSGVGADLCWSEYTPRDPGTPGAPGTQLVVDAHLYDYDFGDPLPTDVNGDADPTSADEDSRLALANSYITNHIEPIAQTYPVMFGELGETDCQNAGAPFVDGILDDAQADGISVFGWTWDTDTDEGNPVSTGWRCPTGPDGAGGPVLITDYDGSPTPMGQAFETWFQDEDPDHPAPPPAPVTTTTAPPPTQPAPVSTPTQPPTTPTPTPTPTATTTTTTIAVVSPPAPKLRTVPHITATGTQLLCDGATFLNAPRPTVLYSWYSAATRQRIAGPERTDAIGAAKLAERAVYCTETVTVPAGSASASSRLLPVPGRVSARPAGPATLVVVCPAGTRGGCDVSLSLTGTGARPPALGSAKLVLKAGKRATATVRLSAAGRRLLTRRHTIAATLTVTETVAGVKQTVAAAALKLS